MKTKLFGLLCAILLPQVILAQESLKTYSGPFGNGRGNATYSYIPAEDGARIFHGKFTFKTGDLTLTGNFQNDLQIGKWTLTDTSKNLFVKTYVKTVYTFTFDDNGLLTGPASKEVYFKNGTRIKTESCNLDEGILDGPFNAVDWGNKKNHVEGQYRRGGRVGKWKFYYHDSEPITVDYDVVERGYPQVIEYDPTTGDTKKTFESPYGSRFDWWYDLDISLAHRLNYNEAGSTSIRDLGVLYRKSVVASDNEYEKLSRYIKNSDYYAFVMNNTSLTSSDFVPDANIAARCIVEKDGTVSDVRIIESVNEAVDADAVRLIRSASIKPLESSAVSWPKEEPVRSLIYVYVSYPEGLKAKLVEKEKALEEATVVHKESKVYSINEVDTPPSFQGGRPAIDKYLKSHIHYPPQASENGIQGKVTVKCIVRSDGKIDEVSVMRGKSPDLDNEAIRVVKSLPKFSPATKNNEPVDVEYTIVVPFVLN